MSLPVACTFSSSLACDFREVAQCGAGLIVQPNAAEVAEELDLVGIYETDRVVMDRNGRRMVEERYTWCRVAAQMVEVYEWLLGGGSPPACVRMD